MIGLNTVETNIDSLWTYGIGTKLIANNKSYCFIDKDLDGVEELYNYETGLIEHCEGEKWTVAAIVVDLGEKDIDTLIKCDKNTILLLIQDGWTIDDVKTKYIYLPRRLSRLKTLVKLKDIS